MYIYIGNSYTVFKSNTAYLGGSISSSRNCNITFQRNSSTVFSSNNAQYGGAIYSFSSNIFFQENSVTVFKDNSARNNGGGLYCLGYISFGQNSSTSFRNNSASYGAAIYSINRKVYFKINSSTTFSNNIASDDGGAINCKRATIYFEENSSTVFENNTANDDGGAIYSESANIFFEENSSTVFKNNTADDDGGSTYFKYGKVYFRQNSYAGFINNIADDGGAIYAYYGSISFEDKSSTLFKENNAKCDGGSIYSFYGYIQFEQNSYTMFSNNIANIGGAIYSYNGNIFFEQNSYANFSYNTAFEGGAIYMYSEIGYMSFEDNSFTVFSNNIAVAGGAISLWSDIHFIEKSKIVFSNNNADEGGAILNLHTNVISFKGDSNVTFRNNSAFSGGSIHSSNGSIHFARTSNTIFSLNTATDGGAILTGAHISFEEKSYTLFNNNVAEHNGGAIYFYCGSQAFIDGISFKQNSSTVFSNNNADNAGGAIFTTEKGILAFNGYSTTVFNSNTADYGGALFAKLNSNITFSDKSTITFTDNRATFGATIYSTSKSNIIAKQNSTVMFDNILAKWCNNACLHYTGKRDTVIVDINGTVWCSNQKQFICLMSTCYCNKLEYSLNMSVLHDTNIVNITDKLMTLSSAIKIDLVTHVTSYQSNISIIGHNNPTVICVNGGRLELHNHYYLIIKGITWIGCGGYRGILTPVILIGFHTTNQNNYTITIHKCSFQHSVAPAVGYFQNKENMNINVNHCNFTNGNHHRGHGVAIYFTSLYSKVTMSKCNFRYNGFAKSVIYIKSFAKVYINNSNFYSNQGVPVYLSKYSILHIYGKVLFENNVAENGAGLYISDHSTILFDKNLIVKFNNNYASNGTIYSVASSNVIFKENCEVIFSNNSATQCGAAIYSLDNSNVTFTGNSVVTFSNNDVSLSESNSDCQFGGTIFSEKNAHISFEENSATVFYNNIANFGAAIFSFYKSNIIFKHKSTVIFNENKARNYGILASTLFSSVTLNDNISFVNNVADNGAGIYISDHSTITFGENSTVKFNNSKAINGTIYSKACSNVIFKANCEVTFSNNSATQYGAAIYSSDNSHVTLTGNSMVKFINNVVPLSVLRQQFGGIIYSDNYSYLSIKDNSITVFINNIADFGAAIYSLYNSNIIFKHNSRVKFINNIARSCGTLTSAFYSTITFNDNTKVTFSVNTVLCKSNPYDESLASAICSFQSANVIFSGHSFITFSNNTALRGGAVVFFESNVYVEEYSTVNFNGNVALYSSGSAFKCSNNSNITIKGNSIVTFNNNNAGQSGGAIYSNNMCHIVFKGSSTSKFVNNNAVYNGGATLGSQLSTMIFEGNSTVTFDSNTADNGGVFYFNNSIITFKEKSVASFFNNNAVQSGGVGYFSLQTNVKFEGFTTVRFYDNRAFYGGAVLVTDHSNITLLGNSFLSFISNYAAQKGGAGYFYTNCNFIMKENALIIFNNNEALHGGAICVNDQTNIILEGNSTALFNYNIATMDGGAIKVVNKSSISVKGDIKVNFVINSAQYGGAIFLDKSAVMINSSNDEQSIYFKNNKAKVKGDSVFLDITESCSLNSKIININNDLVITPPNILKFSDPTICIDIDNETHCNSYYVQNIMLGSEIIIPTCVLDYYNNVIVDSTQFMVNAENNSHYFINGPTDILISCDLFQGLHVMGNQALTTVKNFSINISLNLDHNADWKQVMTTLVLELSPCHLGFWHYPESRQCECYNANDIVFCSDNSSTIKSGYWFGNVTGMPTITFCPINYCNFTCCETTNGYYHLSPIRDNQCRSYRSGAACGSCTHGYTLSFDSTECVSLESCTVGQMMLVIVLTVIYWIVMFAVVLTMAYCRVEIGYLYCITYYYSIVDILLSQNLQSNEELYLAANIISSFSKIAPQFLGKFCLTPGMSGIDQQFIHYIHPSAIIIILVAIIIFARMSQKITIIISRGLIHITCSLLLLTYTSIASTSLLLMRTLTFYEIDKIYSYLSPDIEYFHGRHLAYAIVALLCIVSIVIGLPLLLTIHPFINHKVNFTRIKPLLDQFQGCYKDKYRCFAAYYMICRLVIITIVVVNSSNDFVAIYMLTIVSGLIAVMHQIMKPYNNEILNKFDGIILQVIILITLLSLFSDDFNSPLAITLAYFLIFFPLLSFIAMALFLHRDYFKKLSTHFTLKDTSLSNVNSNNVNKFSNNDINSNAVSMRETDNSIDDSVRANVTVCDL